MCEWLSRWEWCDVKLLCGGRAFSAHRAVLASVSAFLRRILLSCPIDESPTFIVLPDFDIEAMSSVLYYIYNGEVIIKKDNLETFFEIIKTMQIFIDYQNLPNIKEFAGDYLDLKHNSVDRVIAEKNIFSLNYENCEDQRYVNIKKGQDVMDILLQYSPSDCGINDKRFQNRSERRKANLGNLQPSSYGHRQRNSYLRDLFIETYPQNGNVNGLTTGVLAISNECYRAPSVLLTNANGKHLHDDALSERFKKITEHISHLPTLLNPGKLRHYTQNDEPNHANIYARHLNSYSCCNLPASDATNWCNGNWKAETNFLNIQPENIPIQRKSTDSLAHPEQFLKFNGKQSDSGLSHEIKRCRLISDADESLDKLNNFGAHSNTNTNKVAILNQVLDNPWNPRMPINYKPFKKKIELDSNTPKVEQKLDIGNDSNNNIELSQLMHDNIIGRTCIRETKGNSTITSLPSLILPRDDFKCTVCNQMHTSSESLELHARRHSAGARYSCSECGKTFSQLRNFKYHVSVHRGTREFAATCSVCGKYFNDRGYLSSHMKIHRNRKEYKCSLCPKSFNQRVAYNMHVRIHTGVKPHVCSECGKAFSRKMLLKQHQRTHSGERPYACPHCDKRFADRSNMTLHLRLHTGVKPFSCTLCPKSFTKKHHLKSHLNFHTGSKPYSCPRCRLAFTQSSNMRTHLKKCTAPQPTADTTQTHE